MKILFICKHNRFRSKVAEAIFKKINKKDEVKSAGLHLDLMRLYVSENVKKALKKRGIFEIDEKARQINDYDLRWADRIVIVANNVDDNLFTGKTKAKVEKWKIEDADESEKEKIEKIVQEIEKRVKKLAKEL